MQIFFPAEICHPDVNGVVRRKKRISPIPAGTDSIVIEERWDIQRDGSVIVTEIWTTEPSVDNLNTELNNADNPAQVSQILKKADTSDLCGLFGSRRDHLRCDIATEIVRGKGGAR